MTNDKTDWMIEDKDKVSFQLDQNHKLYIERVEGGFTLRVFDERGKEHRPENPILLYSNRVSDQQLGFLEVEK